MTRVNKSPFSLRDEFLNLDFPTLGQLYDFSTHPFIARISTMMLEPMYRLFVHITDAYSSGADPKPRSERRIMRLRIREYLELAVCYRPPRSVVRLLILRPFSSADKGTIIGCHHKIRRAGVSSSHPGASRALAAGNNEGGPSFRTRWGRRSHEQSSPARQAGRRVSLLGTVATTRVRPPRCFG